MSASGTGATPRIGGCLCGAICYESDGEVMFALRCHCRDCQRQSGASSVAAIRVPAARFRITKGVPKRFVAQSGQRQRHHPDVLRRLRDPAVCPGGDPARCGRSARLHARRSRMVSSGGRHFRQKRATVGAGGRGGSPISGLSARQVLSGGDRGMIHEGGCHCGNLRLTLRLSRPPQEVRLRACGCSFCRAHATRTTSDPQGAAEIWARDWDLVELYRFGSVPPTFWFAGGAAFTLARFARPKPEPGL